VAVAGEALAPAAPATKTSEALYRKLSPGPGMSAAEVASHQRARIHGAMIEIVGERGYAAVTVRELARLAGVSTRAFYEHFESKEECFLSTYELVVRRIAAGVVAAQNGEPDWRERLRLAFDAFAREVEGKPRAARLALVEAFTVGSAALERMRRAESIFEAMICESFGRAPDDVEVPPLLIQGIVGGAARVVRGRLLVDGEQSEFELAEELLGWALSFRSDAAAELEAIDRRALPLIPNGLAAAMWEKEAKQRKSDDDRALILAAVAKLVGSEGYAELTAPRIRAAAGVSRRSFNVHFKGVEDCFLAALEERTTQALRRAAQARSASGSWAGGIYRAIFALCVDVARDPILAKLSFAEIFTLGLNGMHCRERLVGTTAELFLYDDFPPTQPPSPLATEASVGAVWNVMHQHVVTNRAHQLPWIAATLSFLVLAPAIGASEAIEAIRAEQAS
jgi:AcrR family transcriptional regulator